MTGAGAMRAVAVSLVLAVVVSCGSDIPDALGPEADVGAGAELVLVEPTPESASADQDESTLSVAATPVPAATEERAKPASLGEQIVVQSPDLFPEGVAWHPGADQMLVGSVSRGGVWAIAADGTAQRLDDAATSPADDGAGTIGLAVDPGAGERPLRILAAYSNLSVASTGVGTAALAILDETGELLDYVDLAAVAGPDVAVFANDVAVDPTTGTAYVTNTATPLIWSVEADGAASVFAQLPGDGSARGLNGIVVHPSGFLIVSAINSGTLFTVPLDDPDDAQRVDLDDVLRLDGLALADSFRLLGVAQPSPGQSNAAPSLVELVTSDGWVSAVVAGRGDLIAGATPTTVTLDGTGGAYVVHSHLLASSRAEQVDQFEIIRSTIQTCQRDQAWPCS